MTSARSTAAQCGAMVAASLLTLRPLLLVHELDAAARGVSWLAALAALGTVLLALRAMTCAPPASKEDPFAGRPARRLSLTARSLAAFGVAASLGARVHEANVTSNPALFWFAALAATALAAWTCIHLRATLIRARFFWALGLGMLLAVLSSVERPDALARAPAGLERLEPGSGVNLVLGVGSLLLGEGHPGAELFALVPLYSPASSAVEPRAPWFRHLSALGAALLVGLLVLALRSSKLGARGASLSAALLAALALALIAIPMIWMPTFFAVFDAAALWFLSGAAAIYSPARDEAQT